MLRIIIPAIELFDETRNKFTTSKETELVLEHSLVSLSKWEAKWKKPFISNSKGFSHEETIDYIRAMTITQNVNDNIYNLISQKTINEVVEYIEDPMTATTFRNEKGGIMKEIITSEIIYFWMVHYSIPFECQKWHLNRLLALIKVCNAKSQPGKKMTRGEILARNRALNQARKAQLNTKG